MAAVDVEVPRNDNSEEREEDLWSAILNDVATSSARNRPQVTKTLLVLGDVSSGKSTLVDRLCQVSKSHPIGGKFPLSGCSLEYRFIDVQDEETDDIVDRMSVWILDGVVWHSQLLSFVLTKSNIQDTTVMIVVDMSQPWTIMESLERWAEVVRKHIQTLQIPDKQLKAMQENLVKQFQSYVDPEESSGPVGTEEEGVALPLGETTLICNIGIPIIVVCCKSDSVVDLEKTHGYTDEHLDFIQQAIRSFCLNYGAALFYVSSKEEKNVAVLHKYLVHRAYGMPFKEAAWVVDKDAVFIPSGWDNEKKISILYEHMKQFKRDQDYSSVVMTPKTTEILGINASAKKWFAMYGSGMPGWQFESEIGQQSAEEDQVFLMAMQAHMVRSPRPTAQQPSTGQTPTSTRHSPRPSGDAGDPSQTSGVLANFFNSLLSNKKQPGGRGSSTMRAAATAELDRLQSKS